MRKSKDRDSAEMRAHYDFTGGVRGKYVDRYRRGRNVILLDPDVAQVFGDSKAVNQTLRALIELAHKRVKKRGKRTRKLER
jgi:hypothetical protein